MTKNKKQNLKNVIKHYSYKNAVVASILKSTVLLTGSLPSLISKPKLRLRIDFGLYARYIFILKLTVDSTNK